MNEDQIETYILKLIELLNESKGDFTFYYDSQAGSTHYTHKEIPEGVTVYASPYIPGLEEKISFQLEDESAQIQDIHSIPFIFSFDLAKDAPAYLNQVVKLHEETVSRHKDLWKNRLTIENYLNSKLSDEIKSLGKEKGFEITNEPGYWKLTSKKLTQMKREVEASFDPFSDYSLRVIVSAEGKKTFEQRDYKEEKIFNFSFDTKKDAKKYWDEVEKVISSFDKLN